MGKRHSRSAKNNSAADSGKPQNKLTSALITSALVISLVSVVGLAYLALLERPAISASSVDGQSRTLAGSQATLLNQTIEQLRLRLSNLSRSTALLMTLEQRDEAAIERFQAELTRAFPEAYSSKLIPLGRLGIAALKPGSAELRNNIELDLVRSVSNGREVEPEAYNYRGKWLFSLAVPVQSPGKAFASGALMLTLDDRYLQKLLAQMDSSLGKTELIQLFRNKEHLIATVGSASGDSAMTADTAVSNWQIRFSPSSELVDSNSHSSLTLWLLLGLILAAVAGGTAMALSALKNALQHNLDNLVDDPSGKSRPFTLPGFAEVSGQLSEQRIQAESAAKASKPASEPSPQPTKKPKTPAPAATGHQLPDHLPESIFRAYDIRGLADTELTDEVVHAIGLAIGSEALDQGQQTLVVAADGRHSSPRIKEAMIKGLQDSGRDVIDIGTRATPLMYFATHQLGAQSGVMITGSHNPAEYNGIKMVIAGRALSGAAIQGLMQRITAKNLASGRGSYQTEDIQPSYIDYIINDVAIAQPLKIVIDAGNGVAGATAPQLFEELGCEVIPLYCEVDGSFPNHHPDPTVEANLSDLKAAVAEHSADLGIAFDGDGDRLGVVTATGQSVAADRLLMLLAQDVVSRNPGADVIFDVKCTRNLNSLISNYGGRPIMWKTGHSFMKEKMAETGALLGGEYSGHIFFKERWFGFDDGMYAAARLIEILSTTDPDLDLQLETFPDSVNSPELKVFTSEAQKFATIDQLINDASFDDGKISTLDGLRVDFPDGWGLVRASNTTPMLILRFEADDQAALSRIQQQFKTQLTAVDSSLEFDF